MLNPVLAVAEFAGLSLFMLLKQIAHLIKNELRYNKGRAQTRLFRLLMARGVKFWI